MRNIQLVIACAVVLTATAGQVQAGFFFSIFGGLASPTRTIDFHELVGDPPSQVIQNQVITDEFARLFEGVAPGPDTAPVFTNFGWDAATLGQLQSRGFETILANDSFPELTGTLVNGDFDVGFPVGTMKISFIDPLTVRVIDGLLDLNDNGVIDSGDTGTFNGNQNVIAVIRVIAGGLDTDDDNDVDADDDVASFLGSGPAIDVIDGHLDLNNDGAITTQDDGESPFALRSVTAATFAALDLNGLYTFNTYLGGDPVETSDAIVGFAPTVNQGWFGFVNSRFDTIEIVPPQSPTFLSIDMLQFNPEAVPDPPDPPDLPGSPEVVPEPSSLALLGIGSVCMAFAGIRRRRKNKTA